MGGPTTVRDAAIPVIDLGAKDAPTRLLEAATSYGFVFVKHNDLELSPNEVADVFHLSKDLFAAPTGVKEPCLINSPASGKNKGWTPMHGEVLDPAKQKRGDFKEAFNMGEPVKGGFGQPLPEPIKPSEASLAKFFTDCHALCNRILRLFAIALEIPPEKGGADWFAGRHDPSNGPSGSILRLLYYPALNDALATASGEDIRAGAHSDYGSITLLFRLPNQPGLEILTPEGEWATVPLRPNNDDDASEHLPILVNIGDLLSYWTNGLLKSTVHRVVFPSADSGTPGGEDRYSIAYFCHPLDKAELTAIPSDLVAEHGKKSTNGNASTGKVMTAMDHLNSRLAATYDLK